MKKILVILWLSVAQMMAFSLFDDAAPSDKAYLQLVNAVKDVVISTQKTRGLTNSFMNGNVAAQLLVYAQREEMMKHFDALKRLEKETRLSKASQQKFADLMKRLKKLNKKALKRESSEVFSSYTALIEEWIALNGEVIDTHFKSGDAEIYGAVSMLNSTLLPLTENIGKLRGLGSGIVARGRCNANETPKMQQFVTNIERYRERMKNDLDKYKYASLSSKTLDDINQKIANYAALTEVKVIGKSEINLDANNYFDQGTACIGGVLKVYNAVSKGVEAKL